MNKHIDEHIFANARAIKEHTHASDATYALVLAAMAIKQSIDNLANEVAGLRDEMQEHRK